MSDWLKLHRSIEENEFWFGERFTKAQAWIDLLLLATYKPRTVFIRGVEIKLQPGDLCYSQLSLAQRWKWNRKTVSTFLSMLSQREMLDIKISRITTVISIRNWSKYQSNGQQSGQQKDNRTDTNKEGKEGKKVKKEAGSPNGSPSRNQQNKSFESVSPVRAFETWWAAEWRRRFRVNYDFKYAKEGSLVKRMLKTCDGHLERLKQIATAHFDSSDNLTERSGYEIGILSMRFNQLNARLNGTGSGETKPAGLTETQKILMEMEA